MQFEEFNKKIKEAAEQHHPAYDEKAWQKMEKMLDKHMPQEDKDRRRIVFFLLFFLLLGGGVFFGITRPWQTNAGNGGESTVSVKNNSPAVQNQPTNTSVQPDNPGEQQLNGESVKLNDADQPEQSVNNNAGSLNTFTAFETNSTQKKIKPGSVIEGKDHPIVDNKETGINNKITTGNEIKKEQGNLSNSESLNHNNPVSTNVNENNVQSNLVASKNDDSKQLAAEENKTVKDNSSTASQKNKPGNKRFLDGFGFSLSGGPDVSKAGGSNLGKTTFAFGAGISYSFKKFTLRTGLYSADKIYSAGENDYELNYTPPQNVKFEGADANCRVLEIPFSLAYNFISKNNNSWFAGAGLSTYLMKREDYVYWYTNSTTGTYYPKGISISNKNKHYFSVLDLSAGFTRKLNNSISITAEPYVKVPFTGIGLGKVHLNSGGVLFTVGIRPFNSNKKK